MKNGVYLLEFASGKFYLGSTHNLDRRIAQHRLGLVRSTRRLGDFVGVAGFQLCQDLKEARRLEKKYKSWKSPSKVLAAMQTESSPDPVGVGPRFESSPGHSHLAVEPFSH